MTHFSHVFNPVSIGVGYSFFLTVDSVWCCGKEDYGGLGLGDLKTTKKQVLQVESLQNINFISCGQGHTCFLDSEGTVWMCGWNEHGQLGNDKADSCLYRVGSNPIANFTHPNPKLEIT